MQNGHIPLAYVPDVLHTRGKTMQTSGERMAEPPKPTFPIPPVQPVSADEARMAYSGPAPFVNKFMVHMQGFTGRITFAEATEGVPPVFRSAVTMGIQDYMALIDVMQKVLKDHMETTGMRIEVVPPKPDA